MLVVNDRFPEVGRLINLGDRALMTGFHRMLVDHAGVEPVYFGWKRFPYCNLRRFDRTKPVDEAAAEIDAWAERIRAVAKSGGRGESACLRRIENSLLTNNSLVNWIDGAIQRRIGIGPVARLKPYLFRSHFAAELVSTVRHSDMVVMNGSGLIADHLRHYLPCYLLPLAVAQQMGKPTLAANMSVRLEDPLARAVAARVLCRVDHLSTREPQSRDALVGLGVSADRITSSSDSAFAADVAPRADVDAIAAKEEIAPGAVALTLRGDRQVDLPFWIALMRHLHQLHGRRVFFVHTCPSHDQWVARKLAKACAVTPLRAYDDYSIVIRLLERFDLFLTDRYHAAIFAIMAGTPVLPFASTTHKMEGLFQTFVYPIPVIDSREAGSGARAVEAADHALREGDALRSLLRSAAPRLRQQFLATTAAMIRSLEPSPRIASFNL